MSSCKRVSVTGDRIVSMAKEAGVRCSDVKCENLKKFLEAFTRIGYDLDFLTKTRPKYDIQEILPPLFRAMETDTPIEDHKLEDLIIALSQEGILNNMLEEAFAKIRAFDRSRRPCYALILEKLYFCENPLDNEQVRKLTKYSYSQYFVKKDEAVRLFGLFFWRNLRNLLNIDIYMD